jgi:hypothetical protein
MTDSASQSYTEDVIVNHGLAGGHQDFTCWFMANSLSGVTSVIWTLDTSDSASNSALVGGHYKKTPAAAFTQDQKSNFNTQQATPVTGPSETIGHAPEVMIAPMYINGSVAGCNDKAATGISGWTAEIYGTENSGGSANVFMDQIVTSSGTYAPTATSTATGTCLNVGISTFY